MKLLEGTHFLRRLEQPSRDGPRSKERVDCLLCPSDDDDGDNVSKRARMGYRLDKLQKHYKAKHKDSFPNEDRTLLDMGFLSREQAEQIKARRKHSMQLYRPAIMKLFMVMKIIGILMYQNRHLRDLLLSLNCISNQISLIGRPSSDGLIPL